MTRSSWCDADDASCQVKRKYKPASGPSISLGNESTSTSRRFLMDELVDITSVMKFCDGLKVFQIGITIL